MNIFEETLEREGKFIDINNKPLKVFFRKNDTGTVDSYVTMFASIDSPIKQGEIVLLKNIPYIVMKQLTPENNLYQKFICVKTNQKVKFMLKQIDDSSKADLIEFDMFMIDSFSDRIDNKQNVITVASQVEFKLSLDKLSKRITINDRFFAGYFGAVWKIIDINYKDNIVSLYCERDVVNPNDDKENGIADRWSYDDNIPSPQQNEINIQPPYDEDDCYKLIHRDTQIFKASIENVQEPKWEITLNPQSVSNDYYESYIDNIAGEFTVTNNKSNSTKLIYTIKELNTGKIQEFKIRLASLF